MIISNLFLISTRGQQTTQGFQMFPKHTNRQLKYFKIKKNNDAVCITTELNLQKNGIILIPEEFYWAADFK